MSWFARDPAAAIAKLRVPVALVYGTSDIQVRSSEVAYLTAAYAKAQVFEIESMNHVLKMVGSDDVLQGRAYADPTLPVAVELVRILASFLLSP
ncbi:MAG: hypothetical protein GKR94_19415 [Gammaproteobacteria bacterium]|nr:hypothetical protein [Gammaproteobacteria bacterium]